MPVMTVKRGDKFRVIETRTRRIAKTPSGAEVDGGGHESKVKADAQVRAINASKRKK